MFRANLPAQRATRSWVAVAGLAYVAAWIAGLLIEPSTPAPTASVAEVLAFYRANQAETMIQTYLFGGVAAVAILAWAAALRSTLALPDEGLLPELLYAAGGLAAGLSMVQGAVGELLALQAGTTPVESQIRLLFDLMNVIDTFKLLALGLFIATTSIVVGRRGAAPLWVNVLGLVLAPALVIGGLGFLVQSAAFYGLLYIVLPMMLVWVVAVSLYVLNRRA